MAQGPDEDGVGFKVGHRATSSLYAASISTKSSSRDTCLEEAASVTATVNVPILEGEHNTKDENEQKAKTV